MPKTVQLMDENDINRALTRLSFEIIEKTDNPENIVLVGIKTRGVPMANILADKIKNHSGFDIPVCELDITPFRDDVTKLSNENISIDLGIDVNKKEIILVDDVLYTGRTIRAAIEAVFSLGRPGTIRLAVLVDRGHRELPIKPDYVGKNVPTSHLEEVVVSLKSVDGSASVILTKSQD